MNDYIYIGRIINTFGIKGELKIVSDFEYKDRIFVEDMVVYIGNLKTQELINTHRVHKNYDLLLFKGYTNINEVLKYKGNNIYIERKDLKLNEDEYLLSDLIGYKVFDENKELGVVLDYEKTTNNVLLKIKGNKTFYIPLYSNFIKNIEKENKKVFTNNGSDLII
mgnify:CR=1 FL=1